MTMAAGRCETDLLRLVLLASLTAALALPTLGIAAPPPGATAQCRDGSYSYS
jgi:hypothetical protein